MFTGKEGESCETCVFFVPQADPSNLKNSGSVGECRRFPPVSTPVFHNTHGGPQMVGTVAPWAVVKAGLWCGEGRPKPSRIES